MTYTFKLARRLAVSRNYKMLPVLLVIAACSGDTTAPESPTDIPTSGTEWRPRDITPVAVQVNPSTVTLETNQLIHFRAHGRTSAGDSVGAAVTWSTSGGTILPDGRFSAAAIGTYTVIGSNSVRGTTQVDTSFVQVVRRPTNMKAVEVTPSNVSLAPGVSQKFTAVGRLSGGSVVPIGVTWSSTGGAVDAGGTYVAGDTAGTYKVIAINTAGTLADTATVTITAPPLPPPPAPAPTPVLQSVTLKPGTVTLAPGSSKQFTTYGLTTTGDSVAVAVSFSATGGTVTSSGLYTAGTQGGSFRIIASTGSLADTSAITISTPLGSGTTTGGISYGPFNTWDGTRLITEAFKLTYHNEHATTLPTRLDIARPKGIKMLLAMTGGGRFNYLTDGVFDMGKWKAKMDTYKPIASTVIAGVTDGTIIGNTVMDEPYNTGGPGNEANSWGPAGTLYKERVDSMCAYVKAIAPNLPTGVFHNWHFEKDKNYKVCDFIVSQYNHRKGEVRAYRDSALAVAKRGGHEIGFSLNILDGGVQDKDGTYDCAGTGGLGTYPPNCRMTPTQIKEWGEILGTAGCVLVMWRYDSVMMADPAYQEAFKYVADRLAAMPRRSCSRP